MKIFRLVSFVLFIALCGCSAQYHLKKAIAKDPHLFDTLTVRVDTLRLPVPEIHYVDRLVQGDTVTINQTDTITHELTRIKYFVKNDTITIQAKCPDQKVITRIKTVMINKPWTHSDKNKYRKQGAWFLGIFEIVIILAYLTRKLWVPLITGGWSKLLKLFQ